MYDILSILKKGELVYNKTSFLQRFLEFMTDFDRNNHGTDSVIYATHLLKKYIPDYVLRKVYLSLLFIYLYYNLFHWYGLSYNYHTLLS